MPRKRSDLSGKIFGWLTVIEFAGYNQWRSPLWKCRCRCGTITIVSSVNLSSERRHTKSCGCWPQGRRIKAGLEATDRPTPMDIAWTAGVYEGEGSCSHTKHGCDTVQIVQNDTWILERLKALFGGSLYKTGTRNSHRWYICGPRARGFLMTIYKFLSPWRQAQALRCLERN